MAPAVAPRNPLQSYDLRLQWGAGARDLRLKLATDANGNPLFYRDTAGALNESVSTGAASYETVPPGQGEITVLRGFQLGAGRDIYTPGYYGFGESIATRSGKVYPGPQVVATTKEGGGDFSSYLTCHCEHKETVWLGSNDGKVYYWDIANDRWKAPATQPASSAKITHIISHNGVLYVAHDNAAPYEYSENDGATWVVSNLTQKYAKFWAIADGLAATGAILITAVDPNLVFRSEDARNTGTWDTGDEVGQSTASDHFTGLRVAPQGGLLLLSKKLGWYWLDDDGNVGRVFGPVESDAGIGMENFAWPQQMNGQLFAPVKDYGLVRYVNGAVPPGEDLSPSAYSYGVPEMQKAITALATDGLRELYIALAGAEGYVMQGLFQEGAGWTVHGAYVKTGQQIDLMWTASHPGDTDKNLYLWIASAVAPYLPVRCLLPRADLETDTAARFVATATWRSGKVHGQFVQEQKVYARLTPTSRHLSASATIGLGWRVNIDPSFTALATFNESPEPSALADTYLPARTVGKSIEVKATLTNASATEMAMLENVLLNFYSKHERKDIINAVVQAETGVTTNAGAQSMLSAQEIEDLLFEARDYRDGLVLATRQWGRKRQWTVNVEKVRVNPDNVKAGGVTTAQLIAITLQEMDSIEAPSGLMLTQGATPPPAAATFGGAMVNLSADQAFVSGTPAIVTNWTQIYDYTDFWAPGSPSRLTPPVAGFYIIQATAYFSVSGQTFNSMIMEILKNGAEVVARQSIGAVATAFCSTQADTVDNPVAGDYYEVRLTATTSGGGAPLLTEAAAFARVEFSITGLH
jgi:hypothetical protein